MHKNIIILIMIIFNIFLLSKVECNAVETYTVYAESNNNYTVTIPKKIILDSKTKSGEYKINFSGNFEDIEYISIIPDNFFTMKQLNKNDIIANINQDYTVFRRNDYDKPLEESETFLSNEALGIITAENLSAGSWHGSFCFNISLEEKKVIYTDFILTSTNCYMPNVNRYGNIEIPGTFVYNDINYKIVGIDEECFANCGGLGNVIIPDTVTTIGKRAFANCNSLMNVTIPGSVTSVPENMFESCNSLMIVYLNEGIKEIQKNAFIGCSSLKDAQIPSTVVSIGTSAFKDCTSLKEAIIPDGVTEIKDETFYNCSSLSNLVTHDNIINFGKNSFYKCSTLKTVVIPKNIENIGIGTFTECQNLSEIYYNGIKYITVDEFNKVWIENGNQSIK